MAPPLSEKFPHLCTLLAGGVTFLLSAALAGIRPLFHDEASTWYFAGSSLQHLFNMLRQDVHPPLYFLLAWGWFRLASEGAALPGLRLISAALMGLSVTVFLQAIGRWFQRMPSSLLMACIAFSPFLVFCGYFARYYALVCLLFTCTIWLVAAARDTPRLLYYSGIGLCGGALFLTNYAAAAIAAAGLVPLAVSFIRRKQWHQLMASITPGAIIFAAWAPFLLEQLQSNLPSRTGGTELSVTHLLKNAVFLVWTVAVSDGMPPWDYLNAALAAALLLTGCYGIFITLRSGNGRLQLLLLISLLMLAAGTLVGWLLLPGPMYSFLTPRVAICGFAWLIVLVVTPWAGDQNPGSSSPLPTSAKASKAALLLVLCIHVWALAQMLIFNKSTNWAYQVPARQIATSVKAASEATDTTVAVYLPLKSFANIRYELEQQFPAAGPDAERSSTTGGKINIVHPEQAGDMADTQNLLIIRNPANPHWPPGQAINTPSVPTPPGNWKQVQSAFFLKEDTNAHALKQKLTGRMVTPYKIRMDEWGRE